jgi:tetratricopeptide (TPR) repeat protein
MSHKIYEMKFIVILFFVLLCVNSNAQNDYDLAESYFDDGEFEKALYYYKKLNNLQPGNSKFIFRIVKIYQELEQYHSVEILLENNLKKTNNPQYLVGLGYNYELQNKLELSKDYYNQAISRAENNPALSYSIAIKFEDYNLIDEAIYMYKFAIEKTQNSSYEYRLANLYAQKKDVKNMFISYLNYAEFNSSYFNQTLQIIGEYINDDESSNYNLILKKIILRKLQNSQNIYWNKILSWLYNKQKNYKKSLLQQKAIYKREQSSFQPIINIGLLSKKAKDYETTDSAFNFIIEMSQESSLILNAKLQLLSLEILLKNKENTKIQSEYLDLLNYYGLNDKTLDLQISYIDFLVFHVNKKQEAIDMIKNNLKKNFSIFSKAKLKLKLGDIYLGQEKFNLALVYYTQVSNEIESGILSQEARFKVAKTSFYKGDFDWAESQLNILKSSTSKLIANDAMELQLLITDHKNSDSLDLSLNLYSKADFYLFQNNKSEAFQILNQVIINYPNSGIVDQALVSQAKILKSENKYFEALQKFELVINNHSSDILIDDAYFQAAELCRLELNFPKKAMRYYEKIIFEFQDSIHFVDSTKHFRDLRNDR